MQSDKKSNFVNKTKVSNAYDKDNSSKYRNNNYSRQR